MTWVILGLSIFVVFLIGINAAMTFAMVEAAKESKVSSSDIMLSQETGRPVQVANNEFTAANGRLTVRAGVNVANTSVGGSRKILSKANGKDTLVTVSAEFAKYELKIKSCMPNSYFSAMTQFVMKQGAVYMELDVLGFVRQPRGNSYFGTVVVLLTHIGRVIIDGDRLSYIDDIGHYFADAGFTIDTHNRRLLNLLEMIAVINSIPSEAYECYDSGKDGPKPAFPDDFAVYTKGYSNCLALGKDMCSNATDAQKKTLVKIEGNTFAYSEGYLVVSATHQYQMETNVFPSRSDKFMAMRGRRVLDQKAAPDMERSIRFMTEKKNFTSVEDLADAVNTGYYCEEDFYNTTERNGGKLINGYKTDDDTFSASYQGVVSIGKHKEVRHWAMYFKDQRYIVHLYDKETQNSSGVYHPVRLDMINVTSNMIVKISEFDEFNTSANFSALLYKPGTGVPTTCHYYGEPKDPQVTSASANPGGGVVELDERIFTYRPYPNADADAIEDWKVLNATNTDAGLKPWEQVGVEPSKYNFTNNVNTSNATGRRLLGSGGSPPPPPPRLTLSLQS